MSNEEKSYSSDFKAKVVLEATSGEGVQPGEVAEKYDVTPSQILQWARSMNIDDADLKRLAKAAEGHEEVESDEIELESYDELFTREIGYGATYDILNMKRLTFWTMFGTGFVILTILALMAIYHFSTVQTVQQVSEQSQYYQVQELKTREQEKLSSFGVVDLENGIYRVPVDSVISRMVEEAEDGE